MISTVPYARLESNGVEIPQIGATLEDERAPADATTDSTDDNDNDEHDDNEGDATVRAQRHYRSTAAMCICTFTHSWLVVSVFPYSGFMVIKLVPGTNEENAGSYAGLLAAAFMAGRTITSFAWGKIADVYGRRIVLFLSLILSALFSILFGISTTFWLAFFWRFLLGASNGIAGISKAIVSETARGDDNLETRGMSLTMGMWGWGFLLGPAISGFLSDPIRQYPHLPIWEHEGSFYTFMKAYPFCLPNAISVILCTIALFVVEIWVPETLPIACRRNPKLMFSDACDWLKGILSRSGLFRLGDKNVTRRGALNRPDEGEQSQQVEEDDTDVLRHLRMSESVSLLSTSLRNTSCDQDDSNQNDDSIPSKATLLSLWSKKDTRDHLILYWIFSFVAIAIDEAFPLFCISKKGGLGLAANDIGKLLSATGLIFAVSQYHVYAWIVDKYGLCKSIEIGAVLSAPLAALIPLSLWLNRLGTTSSSDRQGGLTYLAFIYLSLLLAACRVFGLVFFSSITIATNRTVIPSHRGTMNGLSMLGGSCAKGLGPVFAGLLVSFGISSGIFAPKVGAIFVFATIGLCAAVTAAVTVLFMRSSCTQDDDEGGLGSFCCDEEGGGGGNEQQNDEGGIAIPSTRHG
jgi:MFS family permease